MKVWKVYFKDQSGCILIGELSDVVEKLKNKQVQVIQFEGDVYEGG